MCSCSRAENFAYTPAPLRLYASPSSAAPRARSAMCPVKPCRCAASELAKAFENAASRSAYRSWDLSKISSALK